MTAFPEYELKDIAVQKLKDTFVQSRNERSVREATPIEGRVRSPGGAVATVALAALAGTLLCACSMLPTVQPWEKGNLAKPAMTFSDDALDERFTQHIYNSKENASGGYGVGGGGCGCN